MAQHDGNSLPPENAEEPDYLTGPPPVRPHRIVIELDADDYEHAARELDQISTDMLVERRIPTHVVSGGGYIVRSHERPGGLTGDEYTEALMAWWKAEKAARREVSS